MASTVIRSWTPGDETAVGLLRRLVRGDASAAETAEALFSLDADLEGELLADALHIAAESTTDGDVERAVDPWRELLRSVESGEVATSVAGRNELDVVSFSRSTNVTLGVRVPA